MILIAAAVIDFGCVAQGFVYCLDTIVTNNDSRIQRIKVKCEKVGGSDSNRVSATTTTRPFAPGMSTVVKIELRAETAVNTSEYEIIMFTENSKEVSRSRITSTIIPMDVYKSFDKSLKLQKRSGTTVI
jgi:hypothetical protein